MIYLDTSVVLAELLDESKRPPLALWTEPLVSSRLLEYEMWVRLHSYGLASVHGERARELLGRCSLLELSPVVCARVIEPFPLPVRTLDALHLTSLTYLASLGRPLSLASFDLRQRAAAESMHIPLAL